MFPDEKKISAHVTKLLPSTGDGLIYIFKTLFAGVPVGGWMSDNYANNTDHRKLKSFRVNKGVSWKDF